MNIKFAVRWGRSEHVPEPRSWLICSERSSYLANLRGGGSPVGASGSTQWVSVGETVAGGTHWPTFPPRSHRVPLRPTETHRKCRVYSLSECTRFPPRPTVSTLGPPVDPLEVHFSHRVPTEDHCVPTAFPLRPTETHRDPPRVASALTRWAPVGPTGPPSPPSEQ